MDRNKILQIINDYSLDKSRIIVISGAALVLLNVVETARDIERTIIVNLKEQMNLAKKHI